MPVFTQQTTIGFEKPTPDDFYFSVDDGFTIHAWVKFYTTDDFGVGSTWLVCEYDHGMDVEGGLNYFGVRHTTSTQTLRVYASFGDYDESYQVQGHFDTVMSDSNPKDTDWHHVAVTCSPDDLKLRLFLDGTLGYTTTAFQAGMHCGFRDNPDTQGDMYVGTPWYFPGGLSYESDYCYFCELEILKGFCKWFESFDVPTSAPTGVLEYVF